MDEMEFLPSIQLRRFGEKPATLPQPQNSNPPIPFELAASVELEADNRKTAKEKKKSKNLDNNLTDNSADISSSTSSSSDDEDRPAKPQRVPSGKVRRGLTRKGATKVQETVTESTNGSKESSLLETRIYSDRVKRCFMDMANKVLPEELQEVISVEEEEAESQEKPQGRGRPREQRGKKEEPPNVIDVDIVQEPVMIDDDDDDFLIGPPSPPRDLKLLKMKKVRMTQGVRKALRELNQAKKARLNESIISEPDDMDDVVEEKSCSQTEEISVKVMYIGVIKKFIMKRWEPFGSIIPKVAQEFGIEEEGVSFFLQDRYLPSTETPNTASLQIVDIIDCHVITSKPSGENEDEGFNIPAEERLELYVQRRNCRRRIKVVMPKSHSLRYLMEKYAAKAKLDFTKLRFVFDGDEFGPDSTPDSLDMSNGDCIDVLV